jgi:hypothetical protein
MMVESHHAGELRCVLPNTPFLNGERFDPKTRCALPSNSHTSYF